MFVYIGEESLYAVLYSPYCTPLYYCYYFIIITSISIIIIRIIILDILKSCLLLWCLMCDSLKTMKGNCYLKEENHKKMHADII